MVLGSSRAIPEGPRKDAAAPEMMAGRGRYSTRCPRALYGFPPKINISNEFAQHAASRYPLTASPETNCAKFKNKGRTIIGKIHKEILADFASAVLAWGVHGRTPPPASLRVSAAGRAKALGFPAADRPTAVRISSYTKNIIKVNMN